MSNTQLTSDPFDSLDVESLGKDVKSIASAGIAASVVPVNISGPEALIEFSRVTKDGTPWQYDFTGSMAEARSFVHAIRAQLTKWRERARDAGVQFYPFRTKAAYEDLGNGKIRICLARNDVNYRVKRSVDELFNNLTEATSK